MHLPNRTTSLIEKKQSLEPQKLFAKNSKIQMESNGIQIVVIFIAMVNMHTALSCIALMFIFHDFNICY